MFVSVSANSRGKETLGKLKEPDFSKGSFYANPLHDLPFDDEAIIEKYPSFACPNIWPTEHLPELEGAFKDLGQLVVGVGEALAYHCDQVTLALSFFPLITSSHLL